MNRSTKPTNASQPTLRLCRCSGHDAPLETTKNKKAKGSSAVTFHPSQAPTLKMNTELGPFHAWMTATNAPRDNVVPLIQTGAGMTRCKAR
ncbi:hypothetical protein Bpfe_008431 [Biomphalaria pfeifferi]|uniref:Uncharacterized protein n=1 Tax=Biomphalaria pfeifferi TaxID=112525 RepID=A0AAD8FFC1_BIOPF|nr:hypothetical protein Bpfe_008431 [Biomphalaria pfeifferi]